MDNEPKPLFKKSERRALIRKIKKLENYDDDKIEKINYALSNLNTEGRNERIAKNISNLMNISFTEAYDRVKNTSKARGNNVHEIRNNWDMLKESEIFLQGILLRFIDENFNKVKKCD